MQRLFRFGEPRAVGGAKDRRVVDFATRPLLARDGEATGPAFRRTYLTKRRHFFIIIHLFIYYGTKVSHKYDTYANHKRILFYE